jgi:hypothetical protein
VLNCRCKGRAYLICFAETFVPCVVALLTEEEDASLVRNEVYMVVDGPCEHKGISGRVEKCCT